MIMRHTNLILTLTLTLSSLLSYEYIKRCIGCCFCFITINDSNATLWSIKRLQYIAAVTLNHMKSHAETAFQPLVNQTCTLRLFETLALHIHQLLTYLHIYITVYTRI